MQWGHPQPRSGEGDAAMKRSGALSDDLLHGPLEDRHRELGASFAEFGGWLMPVSYAGTVSEHTATRTTVGLFDVSHLGKALVRGPGAAEFVNSALTNDLDRIEPGKAQYTLCCNESGGVIDDLIAYYIGPDEIFLVPNAANTAAVVAALQKAAPAGLTITDEHRCYAVLAVQGPRSAEVVSGAGLPQRIHRGAGLRAAAPLGIRRRGVRRAGCRGHQSGWPAGRSRGARHAAYRDGLSVARSRAFGRYLAAAGPV